MSVDESAREFEVKRGRRWRRVQIWERTRVDGSAWQFEAIREQFPTILIEIGADSNSCRAHESPRERTRAADSPREPPRTHESFRPNEKVSTSGNSRYRLRYPDFAEIVSKLCQITPDYPCFYTNAPATPSGRRQVNSQRNSKPEVVFSDFSPTQS